MANKNQLYILLTILILTFSTNIYALDSSDSAIDDDVSVGADLNCRLYGAISNNFPDGLIRQELYTANYSLKNMSTLYSDNLRMNMSR